MLRYRFSACLGACLAWIVMAVPPIALHAQPASPFGRSASPEASKTAQRALYGAGAGEGFMGQGAITTQSMMPKSSTQSARPAVPAALSGASQATVIKVGLLLPLTGRNAELGRAMQDAATLSLFDKYARLGVRHHRIVVELLPQDTGDTPQQAARAAKSAMDAGASMLIGPLFADATDAVAPFARAKKVPVLSLSNNLSDPGDGVYMFGFSPKDQTERIVEYAIRKGKNRIAVLAPDSTLGRLVIASAREKIASLGFMIAAEVKYSPQGLGIDSAMTRLLPVGNRTNFDALLIPEGGSVLATILRALRARGVSPVTVQFLGTGVWDDSTLVRRVPLDGAWIASASPKETMAFEKRFRATYQYVPPRITSLAYDAVAFAVTLASSGRPFDNKTITHNAGFIGPVNGPFRLHGDGHVDRGLAIMSVEGGIFTPIDAAPAGFKK